MAADIAITAAFAATLTRIITAYATPAADVAARQEQSLTAALPMPTPTAFATPAANTISPQGPGTAAASPTKTATVSATPAVRITARRQQIPTAASLIPIVTASAIPVAHITAHGQAAAIIQATVTKNKDMATGAVIAGKHAQ